MKLKEWKQWFKKVPELRTAHDYLMTPPHTHKWKPSKMMDREGIIWYKVCSCGMVELKADSLKWEERYGKTGRKK